MSLRSAPAALAAACSLVALAAAPALAAPGDSERTPIDLGEEAGRASTGGGGNLVRTLVGLAVVIGVIYGLHWILKQVKQSREESMTGEGLATLATLPLGPNRTLHVVRAGREVVVLGVAEHGVTPIRTYSEQEARAAGLLPDADADAGATGAELAALPTALPAAPRRPALPAGPRAVLDQLRAWTVRA